MTNIHIRAYRPDDFDKVTLIWRRSREVSLPDHVREKGYSFEDDRAYFRDHIAVKNQIWVADAGAEPAAFMAINGNFIDCLYVDPRYWRRGIGRRLLDYARTLSPGHIWLYTLQINTAARAFYEHYGFLAEKFGISAPPESEPDIEYHWRS